MRPVSFRRLKAALVFSVAVVGIVVGVHSLFVDAHAAKKCICPLVYAPVICNNGTYPNLCVAQCHNGQNCEPIPILPPNP